METADFPAEPTAVRAARRFVTDRFDDLPEGVLNDLILMVSELTSNCVRHARSGFTIGVERRASTLRVEVTDRGPGVPNKRTSPSMDPGGRGLVIVEELSEAWGVERHGTNGKTVWFEMRHSASASAEADT